ncbi:MAG TPA: hypothetical protein VFV33_10340 [Gemmatimonadaceae bacterium]|nr:hypothetical protein [Gemmatimonadaceae bacterium]
MHVSFALFADAANISQEGKLNILGVFDAVQVGALPALHPRAHLVVRLKGGPHDVGQHRVGLRWLNPRGQELWSSDGQIDVDGVPPMAQEMDFPLIASIDLPLDEAGSYTMRIDLDDETHTAVHLMVRAAPPQFVAPAAPGALLS